MSLCSCGKKRNAKFAEYSAKTAKKSNFFGSCKECSFFRKRKNKAIIKLFAGFPCALVVINRNAEFAEYSAKTAKKSKFI